MQVVKKVQIATIVGEKLPRGRLLASDESSSGRERFGAPRTIERTIASVDGSSSSSDPSESLAAPARCRAALRSLFEYYTWSKVRELARTFGRSTEWARTEW